MFLYIMHSDDTMSHKAIISCQLSPISSLLIISRFSGIIKVMCFLLPAGPSLHIFGSYAATILAVRVR